MSVDNDKSRASQSPFRHGTRISKRSIALRHSRDRQPVHLILVVWEQCLDDNFIILSRDRVRRLDDWQILLIDVGHPQRMVSLVVGTRKREGDVLGLRAWGREDGQLFEGAQRDLENIGASSRNDEVLDRSKGKVEVAGRQEWQFTRNLALHDAEPSLLFALLADDRGDFPGKTEIIPQCKPLDDILQGTEHHVCEGGSERNGAVEVLDGEGVLARLNRVHVKVLQSLVRADGM